MDTRTMVPILIGIAVLIVIVALLVIRKRRSEQLKQRFGPEYDRLVKEHGGTSRAEAVLAEREKRVEKFSIRPLPPGERERYASEWANVQKRFVDDPAFAVTEADALVTKVMNARGYPMGDFEQRAADISVSYPAVVQNYRSARVVVIRNGSGKATTEDLRQAMVHYRSLFDELLASTNSQQTGVIHERAS